MLRTDCFIRSSAVERRKPTGRSIPLAPKLYCPSLFELAYRVVSAPIIVDPTVTKITPRCRADIYCVYRESLHVRGTELSIHRSVSVNRRISLVARDLEKCLSTLYRQCREQPRCFRIYGKSVGDTAGQIDINASRFSAEVQKWP